MFVLNAQLTAHQMEKQSQRGRTDLHFIKGSLLWRAKQGKESKACTIGKEKCKSSNSDTHACWPHMIKLTPNSPLHSHGHSPDMVTQTHPYHITYCKESKLNVAVVEHSRTDIIWRSCSNIYRHYGFSHAFLLCWDTKPLFCSLHDPACKFLYKPPYSSLIF